MRAAPEMVLSLEAKRRLERLARSNTASVREARRAATMAHDCKRHDTTTWFAALNVLDGQVIGQWQQHHTHVERLRFPRQSDREPPTGKAPYRICDNWATRKHPMVQHWPDKHPRCHMQFTPASDSWLNRVERFLRDLTSQQLRRGAFTSVPASIDTLHAYIAQHNQNPKPFIRTAKANDTLERIVRANRRLSSTQNGALRQASYQYRTRPESTWMKSESR